MQALGKLWNNPDLVDLGSSDRDVRKKAAEELGGSKDDRIIVPLIASLWDPAIVYWLDVKYFFPVRMSVMQALGNLGNPLAIEPIVEAFRKFCWGYPPSTEEEEDIYLSLLNIGEPMVDCLITILQDENEHVRELAISILGSSGDPEVIEPLGKALISEKDGLLKGIIMRSLLRVNHISLVIPVLDSAVQQESDMYTLSKLLLSLGQIPDERVIPIIKDGLHKFEKGTQNMVVNNIVKFGTPESKKAIEEFQEESF